jgi:carbonic anhydrase
MTKTNNPHELTHLFEKNREWVASVIDSDPDFFNRLANQQSPEYLWIGCSDSRVPANQITGLAPGEVFVHRNIANVVVHTDLNALSVIQFAIDQLKVKHIIVVGHYGCGGVRAAMENVRIGLADNWIRHVKDVHDKHGTYLGRLTNQAERLNRLCELNVIEQVVNVCQTTSVQDAWHRGQPVTIHGWVYGVEDGLARDLGVSVASSDELEQRYQLVLAKRFT